MHTANPILVTVVVAIGAGVLIIAAARRAGLPPILPLLLGGIVLGEAGLSAVQPSVLGDGLGVIVSLLVGVVLFEGGLTLDLEGYRRRPRIIVRLLTVGILVTWLGIGLAVWLIGGQSPTVSILSASLLIVTGPTVVGPLLKRIRVVERLHHVLQWEGVLIDPIGVFVALLCVELLALGKGGGAFVGFALRGVTGMALGIAGGHLLVLALRRRWLPQDMAGVGALAWCILLFGGSELVAHEAGLLTVTVAGFYVGYRRPEGLAALTHFKREVTELAIGMLFILLSARLDPAQFLDFGWAGVAIVAAVIFVVRPLSVAFSSAGLGMPWRERAVLSWIAPRGIVAASMASILALELEARGVANARFVESLTYAVIIGTILLQGGSAGWLVRRLGLAREEPTGWVVVGAHRLGRELAHFLVARDVHPVILLDNNRQHVRDARGEGLVALDVDARDVEAVSQRADLQAVGHVVALTSNEDLNTVVCRNWHDALPLVAAHRWQSGTERAVAPRSGEPLWIDLPSPDAIALELEAGRARLNVGAATGHVLITGDLSLSADQDAPTGDALVLSRLQRAPWPMSVTLELTATSRAAVIECTLARLHAVIPYIPVEQIRDEITAQELELPSSLGEGVALPHARVEGLDAPHLAAVRLSHPVDWDAPDEIPVDIVLVLLSPAEDHEGHLRTLATLAERLNDADLRDELRAQPVDRWLPLLRHGVGGVDRAA